MTHTPQPQNTPNIDATRKATTHEATRLLLEWLMDTHMISTMPTDNRETHNTVVCPTKKR